MFSGGGGAAKQAQLRMSQSNTIIIMVSLHSAWGSNTPLSIFFPNQQMHRKLWLVQLARS